MVDKKRVKEMNSRMFKYETWILEAYLALTYMSDDQYEWSRFSAAERQAQYAAKKLAQMAGGQVCETGDENDNSPSVPERANPWHETLTDTELEMVSDYQLHAKASTFDPNLGGCV
jgi:hypothetical protein